MATIPASENEFPEVLFAEGAAPAAPATGIVKAYAKADGLLYSKDDAGAETALGAAAHIADTTDAHDASAVSVDPTGLTVVAGTDVQTAIGELDAGIAGGGIPATIFDAQGDLIVASAADTAARLALGAAATVLRSNDTTAAWALPPGHEFDYVEITSAVNITATTEGTANTIITGNSVTYDGSTAVIVIAYLPYWAGVNQSDSQLYLYDGSSSIGSLALLSFPTATGISGTQRQQVYATRRLTPSAAAHTYSLRGRTSTGTASAGAGAGGNGNHMPAYLRIVKV